MSKLEQLINELCPDGVEFKIFGSIVHTNLGGGTPSKSNKDYWNGSIPWASVKDVVREGMYMRNTLDFITPLGLQNSPSNLIPKGRLIICTRINPGLCSITTSDVAINQDLRAIRFIENIDIKYIYYYFQTMVITGKGTTVKGISIEELDRVVIPLPPLPVQHEIVRILDNFTELTAELTARKREALVVGDASLLPSRIKVTQPTLKPRSATVDFWDEWAKDTTDVDLKAAIEALRKQMK